MWSTWASPPKSGDVEEHVACALACALASRSAVRVPFPLSFRVTLEPFARLVPTVSCVCPRDVCVRPCETVSLDLPSLGGLSCFLLLCRSVGASGLVPPPPPPTPARRTVRVMLPKPNQSHEEAQRNTYSASTSTRQDLACCPHDPEILNACVREICRGGLACSLGVARPRRVANVSRDRPKRMGRSSHFRLPASPYYAMLRGRKPSVDVGMTHEVIPGSTWRGAPLSTGPIVDVSFIRAVSYYPAQQFSIVT